jgi:hypothetical protein
VVEYWGTKDTQATSKDDKSHADEKGAGSIVITNDNRQIYPHATQESRKKPSWVEKGTLIVLALTFLAALFAGYEANRLANLTNTAVNDAESAATKQKADTAQALEFAKEAAEASGVSAKAAAESATAATRNVDVIINSERARILTGSIILTKNGDTDPQPKVDYTWINFGRGAAIIRNMLVDCQIVGATVPNIPIDNLSKVKHGQAALGSGGIGGSIGVQYPVPSCLFDRPFTPEDWTAIGAGKTEFILFSGFIRYEDAFHKYNWHFGDIYIPDGKFFSTAGLPEAYNQETQEDQPK